MPISSRVQRKSTLLLGMVLIAAGCRGALPPPGPPPYQGAKLRVACPSGLAELVRGQAAVWQARQEAVVEAVEYDPARGPDSVPGADIWLVAPAELARWAAAGRVVPLPEWFTGRGRPFEWGMLLPAYREQLLLWEHKPFAVPLVGEAPVCVYRHDLYHDPGWQERYRAFQRDQKAEVVRELRAPATWEEFALQAEFFAKHHPSGKAGPSLPALPADEAALDRLFYTVAAPYARQAVPQDRPVGPDHQADVFAFHYDLATGKPRIATPGFVAALDLLKRLQPCRPAAGGARPETALLDGQAVLGVVEAAWLMKFQQKPELRDRFGVCVVPGAGRYFTSKGRQVVLKDSGNRMPYLGGAGWLACVPKSPSQQEAALDLLADLAGPARSAQAALEPRWGGGPVRSDQVQRESWGSFNLDRARSEALREALARTLLQHDLKNPVYCLRTPDQASHRAALVKGLRAALPGKRGAKETLAEVSRAWEELDARKGKAATLEQYKISLDLLGK
jgi:ABC-type glycerol-3-phosphate transport system substrate-binding protein